MVCEVCGVTELRADNLSGVCRKTTACDTERSRRFRKKHAEAQAARDAATAMADVELLALATETIEQLVALHA
jgi:hypothetical protein